MIRKQRAVFVLFSMGSLNCREHLALLQWLSFILEAVEKKFVPTHTQLLVRTCSVAQQLPLDPKNLKTDDNRRNSASQWLRKPGAQFLQCVLATARCFMLLQ